MKRLLINEWRLLSKEEQEKYHYVSDEDGCYFCETPPEENQTEEIDDFEKIDLRVVKVLACEPIKGAKKLLKLKVDCRRR